MFKKTAALLLAALLVSAPAGSPSEAAEEVCPKRARGAAAPAWPPAPRAGEFDVVHFGEGHWNEGQGPKTMPILVQDIVKFTPDLVAFSSDMADIGSPDRLGCFRMIMQPLIDADIPWFDSPGNHDRVAAAGPGGVSNGSIEIWRDVFAAMPAPWGDKPPATKRFRLPGDEPDDGQGASTHYYFDYGSRKKPAFRLIVLDNSQQGLTNSDPDQYPAVGPGQKDASQMAFLERTAQEAQDKDALAFVMMHQPTQDPRDPSNAHPVSLNHTMGKGASTDNAVFDTIAQQTGVDAVLLGHIQGNALYSAGDVRYFIDGGGGGSPYSAGAVGTDTGYYYGFRILRMYRQQGGWRFRTYFVPLVDHIEVEAPKSIKVGDEIEIDAAAVQPFDPDLPPRLGGAPNEPIHVELRPVTDGPFAASVPEISYVMETSAPSVLKPLAESDPSDDPVFEASTMSLSGRFEALREGIAIITIRVGTHVERVRIEVKAR